VIPLQAGASFDCGAGSPVCICDASVPFALRAGRWGPLAGVPSRHTGAMIAREGAVFRRCQWVFTFTEALRTSLISDFGLEPQRVVTTYQGPNIRTIPALAELARPKPAQPTVLFVGRHFERKGGRTLVAAFRKLRDWFPSARLRIVGCRPKLDCPGIEVLGLVPREAPAGLDLRQVYREAHVYCMPTRYEPFGTSFVEAMVHCLPCIGSSEYSAELIRPGETGWLVPGGDVDALVETLRAALQDLDQLALMGRAARDYALQRFSWARVAEIIRTRVGL
jgi:starch synthase